MKKLLLLFLGCFAAWAVPLVFVFIINISTKESSIMIPVLLLYSVLMIIFAVFSIRVGKSICERYEVSYNTVALCIVISSVTVSFAGRLYVSNSEVSDYVSGQSHVLMGMGLLFVWYVQAFGMVLMSLVQGIYGIVRVIKKNRR